jgi:hypothetical protein
MLAVLAKDVVHAFARLDALLRLKAQKGGGRPGGPPLDQVRSGRIGDAEL